MEPEFLEPDDLGDLPDDLSTSDSAEVTADGLAELESPELADSELDPDEFDPGDTDDSELATEINSQQFDADDPAWDSDRLDDDPVPDDSPADLMEFAGDDTVDPADELSHDIAFEDDVDYPTFTPVELDPAALPEPVDGFPWSDPNLIGTEHMDTPEPALAVASAADLHADLLAADASTQGVPRDSTDPAVAALARLWTST